jgi:1-deoxy-D-xylulose-5-phosphate reductoisomerase
MRGVAILGSTGSVGASALEVVARHPQRLRVVALAAGRNVELLARQVATFRPLLASVERDEDLKQLRQALGDGASGVQLVSGQRGAEQVAAHPEAEVVLTAMVGAAGLGPTLAALDRGVIVAIANKEPLAVAGQICVQRARRSGATIVPVDSEHSAIFQCLQGQRSEDVKRLLITGSGGPFRQTRDLRQVTVEQALAHPTWSMGPKISVDSATLMNKGLEVMEARWLFGLAPDRIQVLIHPQSVVHSMVEFCDGSLVAQLAPPEMQIPIGYALSYPQRLPDPPQTLDLTRCGPLTFERPDPGRFPCLELAHRALQSGGAAPAVLNAANEVAVQAFLEHRVQFVDIPRIIRQALDALAHLPGDTLPRILAADLQARQHAASIL